MEIEEVQYGLETAYVNWKRVKAPYYELSRRDKEALTKAAPICKSVAAHPEIYILAFTEDQDSERFNPSVLFYKNAGKKFQEFYASRYTTVPPEDEWASDLYKLKELILKGRHVEEILMDDSVDLSPWFRILITAKSVPEIVGKYQSIAAERMTKEMRQFLELQPNLDLNRLLNWYE